MEDLKEQLRSLLTEYVQALREEGKTDTEIHAALDDLQARYVEGEEYHKNLHKQLDVLAKLPNR